MDNMMLNLGKAYAVRKILKMLKEKLKDEMIDISEVEKAYDEIMEILFSNLPSDSKEGLISDRVYDMFRFMEKLIEEPKIEPQKED